MGYVVSPDDNYAFLQAALKLYEQPAERATFALEARSHAEATFAWDPIYTRLETALFST
jgi:hypothetical protein